MNTENLLYLSVTVDQVATLVRQLPDSDRANLLASLWHDIELNEQTQTHYASEAVLAKDWLTDDEDRAWQHL